MQVRDDPNAPAAARVGASNALLDRDRGKPAQIVTQTIEQKRNVREWTDDELLKIIERGAAEGGGKPPAEEGAERSDHVY